MKVILASAALLVVALAPGGSATVVTAGASGQCFDTAGNGGSDWTRVTVDSDDPDVATVQPLTVTGALGAASQFGMGNVATPGSLGGACTNADTLDYVEADAGVDATTVQVCYQGTIVTDGSCPTVPPGPGGPG
ncbi:MAG TPA: hypothetical protein VGR28_06655 [Candidatus Thermoplasmatota archaeon]|jgi:hypothetical protein|nr:hypothetical protein [Candidatus Thermoplasmatota archaeon]